MLQIYKTLLIINHKLYHSRSSLILCAVTIFLPLRSTSTNTKRSSLAVIIFTLRDKIFSLIQCGKEARQTTVSRKQTFEIYQLINEHLIFRSHAFSPRFNAKNFSSSLIPKLLLCSVAQLYYNFISSSCRVKSVWMKSTHLYLCLRKTRWEAFVCLLP